MRSALQDNECPISNEQGNSYNGFRTVDGVLPTCLSNVASKSKPPFESLYGYGCCAVGRIRPEARPPRSANNASTDTSRGSSTSEVTACGPLGPRELRRVASQLSAVSLGGGFGMGTSRSPSSSQERSSEAACKRVNS